MEEPTAFVPFGTAHILALVVVASLISLLAFMLHRTAPGMCRQLGRSLAVVLVLNEVLTIYISVRIYHNPLASSLPFQLCGFAALLTAWMLWRKDYRSYEIAYFWAIGGSIPAMLTPDLALGFPHPTFIHFFFSHGLIMLGVIYATFGYGFSPLLASVGKAILASLILMLVVAPVNLLLGSNYMYLCHKPLQNTLMDYFGPWPWYLLSLVGIGIIVYLICYSPFYVRSRLTKNRG